MGLLGKIFRVFGSAPTPTLTKHGNSAAKRPYGPYRGCLTNTKDAIAQLLRSLGLEMLTCRGVRAAKTLITNAQYNEFLKAIGQREPDFWRDREYGIDAKDNTGKLIGPDLPVVGVSLEDARQFAKWAGMRLLTGKELSLVRGEKANKIDISAAGAQRRPVIRAADEFDVYINLAEWCDSSELPVAWFSNVNAPLSNSDTVRFSPGPNPHWNVVGAQENKNSYTGFRVAEPV